jgi:hypothetical protein
MTETVKYMSVQYSRGCEERHTCSIKCPTQCKHPLISPAMLFPKANSFISGETRIYTHGNITQAIFANMKHFKLSI